MNVSFLFVVPFVLLLLTSAAQGSPIFDLFFGSPNGGSRNYYRRPKANSAGGGYNEYRKICSVVNPDPYAFVGSNPYPGVPFCPP